MQELINTALDSCFYLRAGVFVALSYLTLCLSGDRLTSAGNASQRPSWSLHVQVNWTEALQKPDILNLAI